MIEIIAQTPHKGAGWGVAGVRGYNNPADRIRAIKALFRTGRVNYFVCYRDTQAEFALYYGVSNWVKESNERSVKNGGHAIPYVNW